MPIFVLLIGILLFLPNDLYSLGTSSIYSNFYLSNVFIIQLDTLEDLQLKPLLHLVIGERHLFNIISNSFYVKLCKTFKVTIDIIFIVFLLSFYLNILYSGKSNYSFYLIFTRAWELVAGSILPVL